MSLLLGCAVLATCSPARSTPSDSTALTGGDARRGRAIVEGGSYGCTACHDIPGARGPVGVVGPPLVGIGQRTMLAGQLPNTPDVLVAFLQNPPAMVPATGMPDVRLGLADARDIAAYLYTLTSTRAR